MCLYVCFHYKIECERSELQLFLYRIITMVVKIWQFLTVNSLSWVAGEYGKVPLTNLFFTFKVGWLSVETFEQCIISIIIMSIIYNTCKSNNVFSETSFNWVKQVFLSQTSHTCSHTYCRRVPLFSASLLISFALIVSTM